MPRRFLPLVTDQIYHIFNRGVAKAPIFTNKRTYQRFLTCLNFYRFQNPPLKLSHFLSLSQTAQKDLFVEITQKHKILVEIYCYCLMPNHFHLLVKQVAKNGISIFMRKAGNSYSSYFNLLTERQGALFQGIFKAVRIETDEQLVHVSRYIHLNPYTGHLIYRNQLFTFPWSSLQIYLNLSQSSLVNSKPILGYFSDLKDYQKFLLDEADYKKSQAGLAHLFLD